MGDKIMMVIDGDLLRQIASRAGGTKGNKQAKVIQALHGALANTLAGFEISKSPADLCLSIRVRSLPRGANSNAGYPCTRR